MFLTLFTSFRRSFVVVVFITEQPSSSVSSFSAVVVHHVCEFFFFSSLDRNEKFHFGMKPSSSQTHKKTTMEKQRKKENRSNTRQNLCIVFMPVSDGFSNSEMC